MKISQRVLTAAFVPLVVFGIVLAEKNSAEKSDSVSTVKKRPFTGGIIPEKYLGPSTQEKSAAPSQPGNTSAPDNIRVSDPSEHSGSNENAVATNGKGGIIVGWQDSGTRQCCYAFSGDNGESWDHRCLSPQNPGSGHAGDAMAGASPDGALYAVCMDYSIDQVRISHTEDNGETWSDWRSVQSAPDKPWLGAGRDGMVYVSWLGSNAGWKRSQDYGMTWESVKSIGFINHGTTFGVGGKYVHVLFNQGSGLTYQRSVDYGATAEERRVLVRNQGTFCYSPCNPRMHPIVGGGSDTTGQYVVAVWSSRMNGASDDDVWAVISRDYGENWTDPIRVNDVTTGRQIQAWAAADSYGRIHVIWGDWRHGSDAVSVYYASALEDEFSESVELTDRRGSVRGFYGDYKGITVDGDDVVVTWVDSRNGRSEVFLARGEDLAANPDPTGVKLTPQQVKSRWKTNNVYNLKGEKVGDVNAPQKLPKGKYLRK